MSENNDFWSNELEEGRKLFEEIKKSLDTQIDSIIEARKLRKSFKRLVVKSIVKRIAGLTISVAILSWLCLSLNFIFLSNFLLNISAGLVTAIVVLLSIELVRDDTDEIESKFQAVEVLISDYVRARTKFYRLGVKFFSDIEKVTQEQIPERKKMELLKELKGKRWSKFNQARQYTRKKEHDMRKGVLQFIRETRTKYNLKS